MLDATMQEIVSQLVARGIPATFEYPGYIEVEVPTEERWTFGNAYDDVFALQVSTKDGEFLRSEYSDVVPGFPEPKPNEIAMIVAFIVDKYSNPTEVQQS